MPSVSPLDDWTATFKELTDTLGAGFFILEGLQNYLPGALLLDPALGDYRGSTLGIDLTLKF